MLLHFFLLDFNSLYFLVIAIIATHSGAVESPMHEDTEDDSGWIKQAEAECAYNSGTFMFRKILMHMIETETLDG